MNEWNHFYSYHDKLILLERINEETGKQEFKVERKLLNYPMVSIERLDKEELSTQEEILLKLGYEFYFKIDIESEQTSVDGLTHSVKYMLETVNAINGFKHEIARLKGIFVN